MFNATMQPSDVGLAHRLYNMQTLMTLMVMWTVEICMMMMLMMTSKPLALVQLLGKG